MEQKDEWSEWIEHDGKGVPAGIVGKFVHIKLLGKGLDENDVLTDEIMGVAEGNPQAWCSSYQPKFITVARYRIRKPRGLTILENIAKTVDHKSPADTPCMDAFEGAL